jgi:hypothetical protein
LKEVIIMGDAVIGTSIAQLAEHPANWESDSIYLTIPAAGATINMDFPLLDDTRQHICVQEFVPRGLAANPWVDTGNQLVFKDSTGAAFITTTANYFTGGNIYVKDGAPGANVAGVGTIEINDASGSAETGVHYIRVWYKVDNA